MDGGEKQGLGHEIRRLRKAKGWSVVELAERAGLPKATLYKIEQQNRMPHTDVAAKVARALGVQLADLAEGNVVLPEDKEPRARLSDLEALLKRMPDLPEYDRKFILDFATEAIRRQRAQKKKKS